MKQNIDYYEGDETPVEKVEMNAVELSELIEERINVVGRKSKATIKEINSLIDKYNADYGKTYTRLS